MSEQQMETMEAIFTLCEAASGLSTNDIQEVVEASVEEGHIHMVIILTMCKFAVERASDKKDAEAITRG